MLVISFAPRQVKDSIGWVIIHGVAFVIVRGEVSSSIIQINVINPYIVLSRNESAHIIAAHSTMFTVTGMT